MWVYTSEMRLMTRDQSWHTVRLSRELLSSLDVECRDQTVSSICWEIDDQWK